MKWRVLLAPPRFWEKRNTVENPRRLVNNSKLEFWYCNCTSPEVFATRYRNTDSGPIALNSRKHKGGRRWRQLFRRRVAAPLPSSCIAATAGETPMRETHKTQTDEIPSCFWEADAGESLLCDACSWKWVVWISHATVCGHKITKASREARRSFTLRTKWVISRGCGGEGLLT